MIKALAITLYSNPLIEAASCVEGSCSGVNHANNSSKTMFCKRNIKRQNIEYCSIIKKFGDRTISKNAYLKWCALTAIAAAKKI